MALGGSARTTERLRVNDFMAYYRRVKADFETAVGLRGAGIPVAYPPVGTYPEPVEHCEVCRWAPDCRAKRRADDHLSLVAGASRRQRDALAARDVTTRRGLAVLPLPMESALEGVSAEALHRVREQARLQVESIGLPVPRFELLPLGPGWGRQPRAGARPPRAAGAEPGRPVPGPGGRSIRAR